MIKSVIIDDEQDCIDHLKGLINSSETKMQLLKSFTSLEEAHKNLRNLRLDVLFIDIQLGENNGFDFLKEIKDDITFEVIFTTAYDKYAIQAIKFSALDYLLKPVKKDEFDTAIRKLQMKLSNKKISRKLKVLLHNLKKQDVHKKISVPTQGGLTFVEIQDIIHCRADINYTHLFLKNNRKLTVSKSLKYFDELLTPCNFFRIHNSHLINLAHVKKYVKGKGGYVTMANNSQLQVSIRRKEDFLKQL